MMICKKFRKQYYHKSESKTPNDETNENMKLNHGKLQIVLKMFTCKDNLSKYQAEYLNFFVIFDNMYKLYLGMKF